MMVLYRTDILSSHRNVSCTRHEIADKFSISLERQPLPKSTRTLKAIMTPYGECTSQQLSS